MPILSFEAIVSNGHVTVTDDGLIHVTELTMVMTQKNKNDANEAIRNLNDSSFKKEYFLVRSMPGRGNGRTKLVTLENAIKLVMVLPGEKTKMFRTQIASILGRYLDGDLSLCREIEKNKLMGPAKSYAKFAQTIVKNAKSEQDTFKLPSTSFVYATKSEAFPGLIKIGKTRHMKKRLVNLNTSCAPSPHVVVAMAPTLHKDRDELAAHTFFASKRTEGEFFAISEEDVTTYFVNTITTQYHQDLAQFMASGRGMLLCE
jgi:hypothetical protein